MTRVTALFAQSVNLQSPPDSLLWGSGLSRIHNEPPEWTRVNGWGSSFVRNDLSSERSPGMLNIGKTFTWSGSSFRERLSKGMKYAKCKGESITNRYILIRQLILNHASSFVSVVLHTLDICQLPSIMNHPTERIPTSCQRMEAVPDVCKVAKGN